jgi:hypothetical protein
MEECSSSSEGGWWGCGRVGLVQNVLVFSHRIFGKRTHPLYVGMHKRPQFGGGFWAFAHTSVLKSNKKRKRRSESGVVPKFISGPLGRFDSPNACNGCAKNTATNRARIQDILSQNPR